MEMIEMTIMKEGESGGNGRKDDMVKRWR